MKIFIVSDYDISCKDGRFYIENAMSSILTRYYNKFGKIVYCSRVDNVENVDKLIDITQLIDCVVGINNLFEALTGQAKSKMEIEMKKCNLVIGRVPSIIAYRAYDYSKRIGVPFYAEIMGCAWDAYWNHGVTGKIIAPYMFLKMRKVVRNSDYALYVTKEFLQKRYPCNNESISASNVKINKVDKSVLGNRLLKINKINLKRLVLLTSAAVDVRYKGQEYVIKAIPLLNQVGIQVKYVLIGGGNQTFLKKIAHKYKVENQVEFTGRLSLDEVFNKIDEADIYIQPSLQEGLPRSVIEAMSRACPALGARTAGIPELIDKKCVFDKKSEKSIAKTIINLCKKQNLKRIAYENFENSKQYYEDVLGERRDTYYDKILKNYK